MKSIHLWHGAIGIALVCIGIGIIGAVAYLLYTPELPFTGSVAENESVFSCGETTVVVVFSADSAALTFSDGRTESATYTPPAPDAELGDLDWKRYASSDGFVFWHANDIAFFEQDGNPLYGECRALNQE